MQKKEILIAGAGIGGLSAALALLRAGRPVAVLEQSTHLGDVGAGIMLTPNATRALGALGLAGALAEVTSEPEASVYRRFDDARTILTSPLRGIMEPRHGAKYLHVHRADLHALLVRAVRNVDPQCIRLDSALREYEQDPDGVTVRLSSGVSVRGTALIGADGARSAVRECSFGGTAPTFTGQVAYRGLVPAQGLAATVTAPVSTVWIGQDRHIVQYGLRGGTLVNYVAVVATAAWQEEGWNRRAEVSEVVAEFRDFHPDVLALLRSTPPDSAYKWGLFDRNPLATWTRGRVTLVGDAAHPTLPFMAQGAAMSIEDAIVLTRALDAARDPAEAFLRYEKARIPRTSAIVLRSRAATQLYQRLSGDKQEDRARGLDEVYDYDAAAQAV